MRGPLTDVERSQLRASMAHSWERIMARRHPGTRWLAAFPDRPRARLDDAPGAAERDGRLPAEHDVDDALVDLPGAPSPEGGTHDDGVERID